MATGARGVQPGQPRVRHAVGERERVVHVMNMPAGDTEALFDRGWWQREDVRYQRACTRGEAVADGEQMVDVRRDRAIPSCACGLVRHRLHEQCAGVMMPLVLQR